MFNNILLTLIIAQNNSQEVLGDRGCGLGPEDIFFINSNDDFNQIKNCQTVNGSIFINGDYNIQSLEPMNNINTIEGYLVIYDSHTLMSLKGLHNLQTINAYNPYLLQYGVAIKYNDNPNDSSSGLCFSNLVNWTRITNENIVVSNNRVFCPDCHYECIGCFGPGRLLCQQCVNFRSGNACVFECPNGTNVNGSECIESAPTESIIINFQRQTNEYDLLVSWEEPSNPNGFILYYELFRDNVSIFRTYYDNDGYYSNDNLTNQFIDTIDTLDSEYSYRVEYGNSQGSYNDSVSTIMMYNRNPGDISNLLLNSVGNTTANISWDYSVTGLEPIFEYRLNGVQYIDINSNVTNYTITGLQPYYSYNLELRAKYILNSEVRYGGISQLTFLTDVGIPPVPRVPLVENELLTWEEVGNHRGNVLYYVIYMNNTAIYNGSYLENGLNLDSYITRGNSYGFEVEAFTRWDLMSRSIESPLVFFETTTTLSTTTITTTTITTTTTTTTTIIPDPTTNFLGNDKWENWVWYIIIIGSSILGILLIVLLFCCCKKKKPELEPTRPSLYNPAYETVSVKRNNIVVDEIERGSIRNNTYQPVEFEEEEKVVGFDGVDTDSVEYLQIMDNKMPTAPQATKFTNYACSQPRRRRSETTNADTELNNSLKNDTNYQNTAKRKMSLLDELKEKIPEMVPKNMMNN